MISFTFISHFPRLNLLSSDNDYLSIIFWSRDSQSPIFLISVSSHPFIPSKERNMLAYAHKWKIHLSIIILKFSYIVGTIAALLQIKILIFIYYRMSFTLTYKLYIKLLIVLCYLFIIFESN